MIWYVALFSLMIVLATVIYNNLDLRRCKREHHNWFGIVPWLDRRYPKRF